LGRPPPCDAGVGTLDHRKKAATRLRWRRRRQPITRPGPPPARRSPSPVRRVGRLQGFWAEDASKRSRRGRAWRNRADETISGPAVSHRCHAQPPAPATPAPGAPPSRTPTRHFFLFARRYLAMPATSASVERLFSVAGQVVTAKRARLDPSTVTLLVFLHEAIPGGIEREAYEIIEGVMSR
jgi:hypothetical protein